LISSSSNLSEGGLFPAVMKFPRDYPNKPPEMRFTIPSFWHPNGIVGHDVSRLDLNVQVEYFPRV
jgi:ubiquitin-protein ligase